MKPAQANNLVIDIGNTRTKVAVFDGHDLVYKDSSESLPLSSLRTLTYNHRVENVILSSTAKVPKGVKEFLRKEFYFIHLSHDTPLPISIQYRTPGTLGRDRIAAAVGAWSDFPDTNVLVIDAGTCITMDLVSAEGVFLGGNISPGIQMRLNAMHRFTEKLPQVESSLHRLLPSDWLGDSTENAIRNGGELGAILEVKAFMEFCRRKFRPVQVVLTGGDADFFVKNLKTKIFALPNLVLTGLNKILQYNANQSEGFLRSRR